MITLNKDTIIVGDDTNLLALVIHYFNEDQTMYKLYMYRPLSKSIVDIHHS